MNSFGNINLACICNCELPGMSGILCCLLTVIIQFLVFLCSHEVPQHINLLHICNYVHSFCVYQITCIGIVIYIILVKYMLNAIIKIDITYYEEIKGMGY